MKKLIVLFLGLSTAASAQNYAELMAKSIMHTHPDSISVKAGKPAGWDYEQGLVLKALENVYQRTGDATYFHYIKKNIDSFVDEKGNAKGIPNMPANAAAGAAGAAAGNAMKVDTLVVKVLKHG